jgi:hypothetical protein
LLSPAITLLVFAPSGVELLVIAPLAGPLLPAAIVDEVPAGVELLVIAGVAAPLLVVKLTGWLLPVVAVGEAPAVALLVMAPVEGPLLVVKLTG